MTDIVTDSILIGQNTHGWYIHAHTPDELTRYLHSDLVWRCVMIHRGSYHYCTTKEEALVRLADWKKAVENSPADRTEKILAYLEAEGESLLKEVESLKATIADLRGKMWESEEDSRRRVQGLKDALRPFAKDLPDKDDSYAIYFHLRNCRKAKEAMNL